MPLASYAGTYNDRAYGTCRVCFDGKHLDWAWGAWRCALEHFQDDTFLANGDGFSDGEAKFIVDSGNVKSLNILGRTFVRTAGELKIDPPPRINQKSRV